MEKYLDLDHDKVSDIQSLKTQLHFIDETFISVMKSVMNIFGLCMNVKMTETMNLPKK